MRDCPKKKKKNLLTAGDCDSGLAEVLEALSKAFAPPPNVDPIAWLEEHRRLSPESSRELGAFHFSRAFSEGFMRAQLSIIDLKH